MKKRSKKQNLWSNRSFFLYKVRGISFPYVSKESITEDELEHINSILYHKKQLILNFVKNSIKLGFNAKARCDCKSIAQYRSNSLDLNFCNKCYETLLDREKILFEKIN